MMKKSAFFLYQLCCCGNYTATNQHDFVHRIRLGKRCLANAGHNSEERNAIDHRVGLFYWLILFSCWYFFFQLPGYKIDYTNHYQKNCG